MFCSISHYQCNIFVDNLLTENEKYILKNVKYSLQKTFINNEKEISLQRSFQSIVLY